MRAIKRIWFDMLEGSKTPVAFLPWQGEFGVMLTSWVRYVHGFNAQHKIVCCSPGDEIYYPSATEYVSFRCELVPDSQKRGAEAGCLDHPQVDELKNQIRLRYPSVIFRTPFSKWSLDLSKDIRPPLTPLILRNLDCDVVVGARVREFRSRRNWRYWPMVVEKLKEAGYSVGLIGKHATSFNSPLADLRAWEQGDDGSANVEMLQSCKLYIGSDTGTSHLAALTCTPAIIFRRNERGSGIPAMRRTTSNYFEFVEDGWNQPQLVLDAAFRKLKDKGSSSLPEDFQKSLGSSKRAESFMEDLH